MTELFSGDPAQTQTVQPVITPAVAPNYDDLLVGITAEDGRQKYGTVDKALESIAQAQAEITRLKVELADATAKAGDIDGLKAMKKTCLKHQTYSTPLF